MQTWNGLREFFSIKKVFCVRNLAVMGLMIALSAILSMQGLTIYLTPTFKAISFAYLPGVVVAMLYGPWAALAYGFAGDAIMYIANPQGLYFPGYALSEMISCFIYACFFYKRQVTVARVVIARALILVIVILGLNSIWMRILAGQTASQFFTSARLINNLVQFPFHAALVYFMSKQLVKIKFLNVN